MAFVGVKAKPPILCDLQRAALENGCMVTGPAEGQVTRTLVSSGRTLMGQKIVIADPYTLERCPPDRVGEIWVSGSSVAQGYWNRPEETACTFGAHLVETGEGPFLRTGDLGFLKDGELFVTGRIKDLIILDGLNHYPQDIELTIEQSHPALRRGCSAAFSVNTDDKEHLVIVAEVDRHYQPAKPQAGEQAPGSSESCSSLNTEVVKAIRRAAAEEHGVQVHDVLLLKHGSIPKTSSGKIQRHACRAGFLAGTLEAWSA
jgi:acyl-CoA synthetase (AMP-forming)/AMP-acid ligase II